MITIHQQKMATALTIVIQIMVFAGLVACIIIGPQGWSSPVISSDDETWHAEQQSENTSAVAYPIVGHQPQGESGPILPEIRIGWADRPGWQGGSSLQVVADPANYPIMICTAVGYLPMMV